MVKIDLSIIVPFYNEADNVELLYSKITSVLNRVIVRYEMLFIDDGSTDDTFSLLEKLRKRDKKVKIIKFRRNFGQTAAMDAGFKNSSGNIMITMDGDLQNDPVDIPKIISKLKGGYDVVCGWRWKRRDPPIKRMFSKIANWLRKSITNETIHDSGCTFRAYKKECISNLDLYGEMHRYIPALLFWKGYKIGEIKVSHFKRKYGNTKYTNLRIFKGFLDLLTVKFWLHYSTRPIHLFGGLGLLSSFFGFVLGLYLAFIKIFFGVPLSNRPLLLLSLLLIILGVQLLVFGFLADIVIKIYQEKRGRSYSIEKIVGI